MAAPGRGDSLHTRETAAELRAGPPLFDDEADEASISRGLSGAERLLRDFPHSPRAREIQHRLDSYRRALARWSTAGPQPTHAQRRALLECVLALLADIFAGSG